MVMSHEEPVHLNSPEMQAIVSVRPPSPCEEASTTPNRCECRVKFSIEVTTRCCHQGVFVWTLRLCPRKVAFQRNSHISTHLEQHPASASLSLTSIVVFIGPPCPFDMPLPCE